MWMILDLLRVNCDKDLFMAEVFWITGLSGAGKTTIGKLFFEKYKLDHSNTVFLDGDELRKAVADDLGYSEDQRRKCAMRYSKLCKLLSDQGINVVICTISMFQDVRDWNRNNITGYKEIYIRVPMEVLIKRDQKGLYSGTTSEKDKTVAGVNFKFEEPQNPDIVVDNDGTSSPESIADMLINV